MNFVFSMATISCFMNPLLDSKVFKRIAQLFPLVDRKSELDRVSLGPHEKAELKPGGFFWISHRLAAKGNVERESISRVLFETIASRRSSILGRHH